LVGHCLAANFLAFLKKQLSAAAAAIRYQKKFKFIFFILFVAMAGDGWRTPSLLF
jgi:hypothetical protein